MYSIKRIFIVILYAGFASLLTGCAIDNWGLVDVEHFENKTVHMVKLKSLGFFMSTNKVDAGLSVGFTERRYFYPKDSEASEFTLSGILAEVEEDRLELKYERQSSSNRSLAFAWVTRTNGLLFNSNANKVGFSIGISNSQRIQLPQDFDGVFIFKHSSTGESKVLYKAYKTLD